MANSIKAAVTALLVGAGIATGAFWVGMVWQDMIYTDQCLDMGGGRSPGGHAICVLTSAAAPPPPTDGGVRAASYQCGDGQDFTLLFVGEGRAIVDRGPSQPPLEMTQVPAASGARYAVGDESVWIKGTDALRTRPNETGPGQTCALRRGPAPVPPKRPNGRG